MGQQQQNAVKHQVIVEKLLVLPGSKSAGKKNNTRCHTMFYYLTMRIWNQNKYRYSNTWSHIFDKKLTWSDGATSVEPLDADNGRIISISSSAEDA
jgi:hypothetical protein